MKKTTAKKTVTRKRSSRRVRFFSVKENQELFLKILEANKGHIEKTCADPRIDQYKQKLYEEFNKHKDTDFQARVNFIQNEHESKKKYRDKKWEESTSDRTRRIIDAKFAEYEAKIAAGEEVDIKELNLLRYMADDHLKTRKQVKSYDTKNKILKDQLEKLKRGESLLGGDFQLKIVEAE